MLRQQETTETSKKRVNNKRSVLVIGVASPTCRRIAAITLRKYSSIFFYNLCTLAASHPTCDCVYMDSFSLYPRVVVFDLHPTPLRPVISQFSNAAIKRAEYLWAEIENNNCTVPFIILPCLCRNATFFAFHVDRFCNDLIQNSNIVIRLSHNKSLPFVFLIKYEESN